MMPEILHPAFLLLLAIPALLVPLALRRSLADMTPAQQRLSTLVRCLLLLLVALALAGIRWNHSSTAKTVLFLVDDSASLTDAARESARAFVEESNKHRGAADTAGVIGFAQTARIWQNPNADWRSMPAPPDAVENNGTDMRAALDLAQALLPSDRSGHIVLLSDGNDTAGNAVQAAGKSAAAGVPVDTVLLENGPRPEVLVEEIVAPERVRPGEPFDATVRVRSSGDSDATVRLFRNQYLLGEQKVPPGSGVFSLRFAGTETTDAFTLLEADITAGKDSFDGNNRLRRAVVASGATRVLLIDGKGDDLKPLAGVLDAGGFKTEIRPVAGLPVSLEDLQQFDLLVLGDVSALQLGPARMELLAGWVRDFGGGFLMLGGGESFGSGGFYRTPVEDMLPVRMEHEDRQETPSVALLVVLDRSGSMAAQADNGRTKMSLANQGAAMALNVLQPRDSFGVHAVDTRVNQVIPLGPITSRTSAEERVLGINSAGGGIYVFTALSEAFRSMEDSTARIKHVILFSDAADAEEKVAGEMDGTGTGATALELASTMHAAGITTSVVALGLETDRDTLFLRQLAERGNGRFYLTNDPLTLPQIFTTETMKVAQNSVVEEPFHAVPVPGSEWIAGIDWTAAPLLLGVNSVKPKPGVEMHLATEFGDPLLASWRYGLGQTVAFTTDAKARWASEWLGWEGFGKLWQQIARAAARSDGTHPVEHRLEKTNRGLRLTLDMLTPAGRFLNGAAVTVVAADSTGQRVESRGMQIAPGRYEALLDLPSGEMGQTWVLSVDRGIPGEPPLSLSHTEPYPDEFRRLDSDADFLRRLAASGGGAFNPRPADVFARNPNPVQRKKDLTSWFLIAAMVLLPVDIWVRRRVFSR